jgi:hypothetical protein
MPLNLFHDNNCDPKVVQLALDYIRPALTLKQLDQVQVIKTWPHVRFRAPAEIQNAIDSFLEWRSEFDNKSEFMRLWYSR